MTQSATANESMNKCLGCIRGQAATNETELPQLEETGLAYGRDVVSHSELCVEENTNMFTTPDGLTDDNTQQSY